MWPWLPERVVVVHIPCVFLLLFFFLLCEAESLIKVRHEKEQIRRSTAPLMS